MNETEEMLMAVVRTADELFGQQGLRTRADDPAAFEQGYKWLSAPGRRVEIRIDLAGLITRTTHITVRGVVIDSIVGKPIGELFALSTERPSLKS
jgi:hypothetical protein